MTSSWHVVQRTRAKPCARMPQAQVLGELALDVTRQELGEQRLGVA
jgi:hypothetical protein